MQSTESDKTDTISGWRTVRQEIWFHPDKPIRLTADFASRCRAVEEGYGKLADAPWTRTFEINHPRRPRTPAKEASRDYVRSDAPPGLYVLPETTTGDYSDVSMGLTYRGVRLEKTSMVFDPESDVANGFDQPYLEYPNDYFLRSDGCYVSEYWYPVAYQVRNITSIEDEGDRQ
jgi:hypothetical protein